MFEDPPKQKKASFHNKEHSTERLTANGNHDQRPLLAFQDLADAQPDLLQ